MIKRQHETTLTFDRAPVQLQIGPEELETVGNSYRATVLMTYDGYDWKADVTLIESMEPLGSKGWMSHWVKDQLPRDEIAKIETYMVEQFEEEMEEA